MTREEQAKKERALIISDDMEFGTPYSSGYNKGIEVGVKWADEHPIINLPEILRRERNIWLTKCCDVVRNTKMSQDLKEHLINTFMRL